MTNEDIDKRLAELRIIYSETKDLDLKEEVKKEASDLKSRIKCYFEECLNYVASEDKVFPFCSQECKDKYWEGKPKLKLAGRKWSIQEMQIRLKEMGEEAKVRKGDLYGKAQTIFK